MYVGMVIMPAMLHWYSDHEWLLWHYGIELMTDDDWIGWMQMQMQMQIQMQMQMQIQNAKC